jgi:hypothetical protein
MHRCARSVVRNIRETLAQESRVSIYFIKPTISEELKKVGNDVFENKCGFWSAGMLVGLRCNDVADMFPHLTGSGKFIFQPFLKALQE